MNEPTRAPAAPPAAAPAAPRPGAQKRLRSRSQGGRAPSLTRRGQSWAAGAAALFLLGAVAGSPRLVTLGLAALAALGAVYVAFFPTSVLVWRRHLELLWRVERPAGGAFIAGRPFRLTVTLRNRAPRALGQGRLRVFTSSALEPPSGLMLELPAAHEATAVGAVRARQVGWWFLHGVAVELRDRLGLCAVEAYFPSPLSVKVLPRPSAAYALGGAAPVGGAPHERLGLHTRRVRGLGGDLRELRDYAPGDPFKQIAWKATARTGKPMVRELDRETMVTHFLLVDVGAGMRAGVPGRTKLDLAIDVAAAYARAALDAGDRVGLITYDRRIIAEVKPADGAAHRLRLVEPLMDAMSPVDEDLTELTESELVSAVARYLLLQEGVDARLRRAPPIDDPAWARLAASPGGELYDLDVIESAVQSVLARVRGGGRGDGALRRFCRLRGIELPYRRTPDPARRVHGLGAAIERAAAGRGRQRIVVLSDLEELGVDLGEVARAVRLVRRRGHHLTCALPLAAVDDSALGRRLGAEAAEANERTRRRLAALGVRVTGVGARPLGSEEPAASASGHLAARASGGTLSA